jgi:hypothetical protein
MRLITFLNFLLYMFLKVRPLILQVPSYKGFEDLLLYRYKSMLCLCTAMQSYIHPAYSNSFSCFHFICYSNWQFIIISGKTSDSINRKRYDWQLVEMRIFNILTFLGSRDTFHSPSNNFGSDPKGM